MGDLMRAIVRVLRSASLLAAVTLGISVAASRPGRADEPDSPTDPIASIDGKPVYLGELNLILAQRLGPDKVHLAAADVRRAVAVILIRRHLAMEALLRKGGESLEDRIRKDADAFTAELKRRGSSLAEYAKSKSSDPRSVTTDFAWQTAWRMYLQSHMTNENLRKYFDRQLARYDGGRWNVSQIFLPLDSNDTASIETVIARMTNLADDLRSAESVEDAFAAAARQHSQAGSADQGGKIGWIEQGGDLPTKVMRVIEQLDADQISDPIRSALGAHLVMLHEREPGTTKFDEMTDQSQLRRDAADMLFMSLVDEEKDAKVVWHFDELTAPALLP